MSISGNIGRESDGEVYVVGGTTNALIGNTGTSLNVAPTQSYPSLSSSGTLSSLNSTFGVSSLDGYATAGVLVGGTWVGTITFQGSVDGTTFVSMNSQVIGDGTLSTTTSTNGSFRLNITGLKAVRLQMTSYTSGSASVSIQCTPFPGFIRTLSTLAGGTDGTQIGNTGDRLRVDASVVLAGGATQSYTSKLRYADMNVSNGGIARLTSITAASGWNTVYSYSGSGLLSGLIISLETKDDWQIRLIVDGEEIFPGVTAGEGILSTDIHTDSIYDSDTSGRSVPELDQDLGLYWGAHDRFQWVGPLLIPVTFTSSVVVRIRRAVGAATKKFQAGFVVIEKKT